MYVIKFLGNWGNSPRAINGLITLISMHVHQKILGFFLLINALLCSQRVNVLVLLILFFLYFAFLQANNIPDPNIIIFEMTKDDRKDFYRTIGKQIVL